MSCKLSGFKAVGYCRVSTDDKGQTNETQAREIRNWARNNEVELLEVFQDEMTGKTLNRPGLQSAIGFILMNQIPLLIAYDSSRLTRNEDLKKIQEMIPNTQIRFTSLDLEPDTIGARLNNSVRQVLDKEENLVRSHKTKLGMETRKLDGQHVGRPARFMFTDEIETAPRGRYKPGVTIIHTRETIVSMLDSGLTVNKIAKLIGVSQPCLRNHLLKHGLLKDVNL